MSQLRHTLTDLLANLRAIHWHAWNTHWKAQGGDSYSDHLLFQRIYAGDGGGPKIEDQIDGLGERIIALFGNRSVDGVAISRKAADIHQRIQDMGRVAGALALEKEALQRVAAVADQVEKGPAELRVSLDNFVRELADSRSTVIYLLQQRLKGGTDNYGAVSADTLSTGGMVGGAALITGIILLPSLVITPFILKAFVPKWSYGRRVVAGFGLGMGIAAITRVVKAANPSTVVVEEARSNVVYLDDYRDVGTLVDEDEEALFTAERRGQLMGWAFLGLMGYVAYWNSQQPQRG